MYQLSVVVDDIDMRITHVIRGADHISNTPKQVLLYRALGAEPPVFAHVPLILGPDKSRLSKRHGATDVNMYRTEGFLPEAFRNFLSLLGWSPGGDDEFLRTSELDRSKLFAGGCEPHQRAFSDRPKLGKWFNTQYLQKLPIEELLPEVEKELKRSGLWKPEWADGAAAGPDGRDHAWFSKDRGFAAAAHTFECRILLRGLAPFSATTSTRDPAAKEKNSGRRPQGAGASIAKARGIALAALPEWSHDRLRPRGARRGRRLRRESRIADQRHARGDRRRRQVAPPLLRHHGCFGPGARSPPFPRRGGWFRQILERASLQQTRKPSAVVKGQSWEWTSRRLWLSKNFRRGRASRRSSTRHVHHRVESASTWRKAEFAAASPVAQASAENVLFAEGSAGERGDWEAKNHRVLIDIQRNFWKRRIFRVCPWDRKHRRG